MSISRSSIVPTDTTRGTTSRSQPTESSQSQGSLGTTGKGDSSKDGGGKIIDGSTGRDRESGVNQGVNDSNQNTTENADETVVVTVIIIPLPRETPSPTLPEEPAAEEEPTPTDASESGGSGADSEEGEGGEEAEVPNNTDDGPVATVTGIDDGDVEATATVPPSNPSPTPPATSPSTLNPPFTLPDSDDLTLTAVFPEPSTVVVSPTTILETIFTSIDTSLMTFVTTTTSIVISTTSLGSTATSITPTTPPITFPSTQPTSSTRNDSEGDEGPTTISISPTPTSTVVPTTTTESDESSSSISSSPPLPIPSSSSDPTSIPTFSPIVTSSITPSPSTTSSTTDILIIPSPLFPRTTEVTSSTSLPSPSESITGAPIPSSDPGSEQDNGDHNDSSHNGNGGNHDSSSNNGGSSHSALGQAGSAIPQPVLITVITISAIIGVLSIVLFVWFCLMRRTLRSGWVRSESSGAFTGGNGDEEPQRVVVLPPLPDEYNNNSKAAGGAKKNVRDTLQSAEMNSPKTAERDSEFPTMMDEEMMPSQINDGSLSASSSSSSSLPFSAADAPRTPPTPPPVTAASSQWWPSSPTYTFTSTSDSVFSGYYNNGNISYSNNPSLRRASTTFSTLFTALSLGRRKSSVQRNLTRDPFRRSTVATSTSVSRSATMRSVAGAGVQVEGFPALPDPRPSLESARSLRSQNSQRSQRNYGDLGRSRVGALGGATGAPAVSGAMENETPKLWVPPPPPNTPPSRARSQSNPAQSTPSSSSAQEKAQPTTSPPTLLQPTPERPIGGLRIQPTWQTNAKNDGGWTELSPSGPFSPVSLSLSSPVSAVSASSPLLPRSRSRLSTRSPSRGYADGEDGALVGAGDVNRGGRGNQGGMASVLFPPLVARWYGTEIERANSSSPTPSTPITPVDVQSTGFSSSNLTPEASALPPYSSNISPWNDNNIQPTYSRFSMSSSAPFLPPSTLHPPSVTAVSPVSPRTPPYTMVTTPTTANTPNTIKTPPSGSDASHGGPIFKFPVPEPHQTTNKSVEGALEGIGLIKLGETAYP
ncbi:hypothetical protein HK102_008178, partial [Quaeritorhiza haematococci]